VSLPYVLYFAFTGEYCGCNQCRADEQYES
jgi:hypothetical protein